MEKVSVVLSSEPSIISCFHILTGWSLAASHLSDSERSALIKSARTVLDSNGFPAVPLLVGTGTGSAHQTIKLCQEAKVAGADYAIVIAPGYFAFGIGRDKVALKAFFTEVLEKSPIPIMIYNFPRVLGVSNLIE